MKLKLKRTSSMMLRAALPAALLALTVAQPAFAAPKKTELLVSAAASLKDSLAVIEKSYEASHPTIDLVFNLGASGTLQKQIEQGAPADLFISAGQKQMDALVKEKLISRSTTLLYNELVMVVPTNSHKAFTTVKQLTDKDIKNIAIGQPESVPAGQYAKDTLTTRKVWDSLQSKLIYAKDVRQVLTYVETGNVDAGFVYKTDALTSKKVKIALRIIPGVHKPIVYPAGIVAETKHAKEAADFYAYLQSNASDAVFAKYGFKLS
ncbi:molybdate transport system substrate-binding protein [Paenibacillus sp. OV219]|nr:molybdate ABC transporter substrate-binding protein [Paenibacillus sp. OV219]SEO33748.1 molybdate transport system substrate-binding protein [Paenibacillus sp. OV219]